jgi:hypothetical protein
MTAAAGPSALTEQDRDHLRLLSIFHFVVAGATALFSSLFLIHFFVGMGALLRPDAFGPKPPPPIFGLVFAVMGGGVVLAGWALAAGLAFAGLYLRRQVHYMFCLVVAALATVCCQPLGTVLGVLTIIVLMRPSVKAAFHTAGGAA